MLTCRSAFPVLGRGQYHDFPKIQSQARASAVSRASLKSSRRNYLLCAAEGRSTCASRRAIFARRACIPDFKNTTSDGASEGQHFLGARRSPALFSCSNSRIRSPFGSRFTTACHGSNFQGHAALRAAMPRKERNSKERSAQGALQQGSSPNKRLHGN